MKVSSTPNSTSSLSTRAVTQGGAMGYWACLCHTLRRVKHLEPWER